MTTKNHAILKAEVEAHLAADALVQGEYWVEADNTVGGKGCFIGCLSHGSDASVLFDRFGLPGPLVKIAENIFEALPEDDAKAFFAAIPDAVGSDGKDLSRVHWSFLASELRALPPQPSHIQDVIDPVIKGMDLLADGEDAAAYSARAARAARAASDAAARTAPDAARAVRAAAKAAYAADAAAFADRTTFAARTAAYAADAARAVRAAAKAAYAADAARAVRAAAKAAYAADAARIRQRDTLINLITSAPVTS